MKFFALLTTLLLTQFTAFAQIEGITEVYTTPNKLLQTIGLVNAFLDNADTAPLAPDCKANRSIKKQKKCTEKFIYKNISNSITPDKIANIGLSKFSTEIDFIINELGEVIVTNITGDFEAINDSYFIALKNLPKFIPATKNRKPIKVPFKATFKHTRLGKITKMSLK
ncbi:hypothetical protein [Aestuariibaculum sediminum]|uniref:TonB C-terminal domain-containing protein n=1 Tax=Aestuariibaculum sediminum TaxID=2770637 RepID=A0A8J6Q7B8_9FLAO|nr:hypothetical protein [Aestuariibaculum sediminum]MBD0832488.1 hypothetical protein [Aestuariibaculum sediminum]